MKAIIGPGAKLRGYIRDGYYLKTTKLTVRPGGALVGFGDVLLTLLED